MKKTAIVVAVIIVLFASLNAAGHYYRYEFYDWAINFEASQAKLAQKANKTERQSFNYFEGPRVEGQESIIMLHGFGASKENWLRFSSHFTDNYHVIALDLKGHGDNKRDMSDQYSVEDQVAFVRDVAATLKLDKFHLVGNSMGGAISSLYAATYPGQVLSATLISPAGVHDIPSDLDKGLENGTNPLIAKSEDEFEDLLDFAMEAKPYIPGPIVRVEAEKAVSRAALNELIFSHLRADLEKGIDQKLTDVQAPVLIIWGDQDRAINVGNIEKYAELIPNAKKLVLEDIGHVAMIEVPEIAANAMLSFIQK